MLKYIPFVPKLYGDYIRHFYDAVEKISSTTPTESIEQIIIDEISWVEDLVGGDLYERKKYRAIWLFLRDLLRAAWRAEFRNNILELRLPNLDDRQEVLGSIVAKKKQLRQWMSESREDRLYSYKEFIERMETPNRLGFRIQDLIADGSVLYSRIKSEGIAAIDPELELVDNGHDKITGLRLSDIWRYFRLTWSTPAETTPGRTMQYLIRDKRHPHKAIIGIASIENSAVQIAVRDDRIGWTPKALIRTINQAIDKAEFISTVVDSLLGYISEGVSSIDFTDLSVSDEAINSPTDATIRDLQIIAKDAEQARQNSLSVNKSTMLTNAQKSELGTIALETEENLYRRKRADQLAKYLSAKKQLATLAKSDNIVKSWERFCDSDSGYSALRTALIARKMQHIGSSIMELNVCGAIRPYNELLAGKLVALLAMSPQVINDYAKKYSTRKSEIATRLKNKDVIRPAKLVYMGTTSLYYVGSSQYNRLKIPKEALRGGLFDVKWEKIGMTLGFGTMHISRATSQAFQEVLSNDIKRINHVFGEGSSPKMRIMSSAIRQLLYVNPEETRELSKHAMSRIVYGAPLISNLTEYLLGNRNKKPQYYCDTTNLKENTLNIIQFWKNRWLESRIQYKPALDRVLQFNKDEYLVGNTLKSDNRWEFKGLTEGIIVNTTENDQLDFLRGFYKGKSAYSDHVDSGRLRKIHVETKLDNAIMTELKNRNDVVLTGNPGDGKTHILRVLDDRLNAEGIHPVIEIDASTKTSQEIYNIWKKTRQSGKQFVLAINAAILYGLYKEFSDFEPISSAFAQMINATNGTEFDPDQLSNVVVFDLSRRNVLHKSIVRDVIKKLTNKDSFIAFKKIVNDNFEDSDINRNVKLLGNEVFISRISAIFDRLYLTGYHATLRELQSFFSFLLLGDRDLNELIRTSSKDKYKISQLIYRGKGKFFDEIGKTFDPVKVSHPQIDESLLNNTLSAASWIEDFLCPKGRIAPERVESFEILKRDFFFFNKEGNSLFDISDDYVSKFNKFLNGTAKDKKTMEQRAKDQKEELISLINVFFGNERDSKRFDVWQGHRFDFSQRRILFSTQTLRSSDLDIEVPRLNSIMQRGIDFSHNYIYLVKKNSSTRLKIDFEFYSMLLNVDRGIPMLYMDNDMVKRMWTFIEHLSDAVDNMDDEIEISLFNVQSKKRIKVELDKDGVDSRFTKIS
jgi:hypothetical protein